jgi:hypothetical protein
VKKSASFKNMGVRIKTKTGNAIIFNDKGNNRINKSLDIDLEQIQKSLDDELNQIDNIDKE